MTVRKSTACNMYNINIIKLFMSLLFHWSVVVCIVYIYICYLDKKKILSLYLSSPLTFAQFHLFSKRKLMNDRLATENWLFSASIYAVCVSFFVFVFVFAISLYPIFVFISNIVLHLANWLSIWLKFASMSLQWMMLIRMIWFSKQIT